jgi:hypothetical protein
MIIRIMGEGQFDVSDVESSALQGFDDEVERAFESGDDAAVRQALTDLHTFIIEKATPVADDYLGASDVVVPSADATLEDIRELLNGDGFIPNGD